MKDKIEEAKIVVNYEIVKCPSKTKIILFVVGGFIAGFGVATLIFV